MFPVNYNFSSTAAAPNYFSNGQIVPGSVDQFGALRITARPPSWPNTGRYKLSTNTGAYTSLAAGSELFHFRWTDPLFTALIWQVSVSVIATVNASAQAQVDRQLVIARNWTVDGSGGTALTTTGNAFKLKTSYPTSRVGTIRVTSNAALGTGTKTNDAQGMGVATSTAEQGTNTTVPATFIIPKTDLYNANQSSNAAPIQLLQNEGVVVLMPSVEPTGMTLMTYVEIDWSEVPNGYYP